MNAYEQLLAIREQLEMNGASEDSITLVDRFIDRAESERDSDTTVPMAMMIKHLLRQREALDNDAVFNDLQELMDDARPQRRNDDPDAAPFAWEAERKPKPHSYYKQQKQKGQK